MFIMAKHATPEKSDTPVITNLHSRLSKMVNAKTYRFKLRKAIKIRSIADISADETDSEGRTFTLKLRQESKKQQLEREKSELIIGGAQTLSDTPRPPKAPAYKVYHFKAASAKAQMNWITSISKLMRKVQR